ncbi:hypothetical protein [Marinitenerispora sediminis]|uniref:Uncharacterized protein n=1 Tax=Marinitenerispora sediminis TaxID=1931232 RepID=A0A368SZK9_9ACTN|nr:hypothetical protein [Marinitenerispora sediminis]RCV48072.1 hypothetical protein DEF28_24555 [Marinitenerispora sediminis]RCV51429.1 hypothetical protein DEF24_23210 [Marinitenerispora sediminis]RCV57701.1 hypothetical protein DEF23_10350 [Marinitenerispora sediminis]
MTEEVRPFSTARGDRAPWLGGFNGIGILLMPVSREDAQGRHFAVRWLWLLFVPVLPLGRYYVTEGPQRLWGNSEAGGVETRYDFHGVTRMKAAEIVRTYAWFWLLLLPAMFLPSVGFALAIEWIATNPLDRSPVNPWWWAPLFASLAAMALWPVLAFAGLMGARSRYWTAHAPVHEVRWADGG